jgi:hypothetical protein
MPASSEMDAVRLEMNVACWENAEREILPSRGLRRQSEIIHWGILIKELFLDVGRSTPWLGMNHVFRRKLRSED